MSTDYLFATRKLPFWFWILLILIVSSEIGQAGSLKINNRISPRNRTRPVRSATKYIVLHTTEGGEAGSFKKVWSRGEAHYFVTLRGGVFRIIDKARIATHAGLSMWEGSSNIDKFSIGIEVVGYHDKDLTATQINALRELLRQLKGLYGITDQNVLTHSMVAYGLPNQFHPTDHRGRKRCGMIFARDDVRKQLLLNAKPKRDRDVDEGRLKIADFALHDFLYGRQTPTPTLARGGRRQGDSSSESTPAPVQQKTVTDAASVINRKRTAWQILGDQYNRSQAVYVFPDGTQKRGNEIRDWTSIPSGTRVLFESQQSSGSTQFVETERSGQSASTLAGEAHARSSTIYFFPNGFVRTGLELRRRNPDLLDDLPQGTRILVGYTYGGHVFPDRLPQAIAGNKWNVPSTVYRFPDGRMVRGDEIEPSEIPSKTLIFYQN